MIFLTTTSDEPDFELANRCLVRAVNEDRDQRGPFVSQRSAPAVLERYQRHQMASAE